MFTGIIEEIGTVKALDKAGDVAKLRVLAFKAIKNIQPGESVSVNGVCLTVVLIKESMLCFDIMPQTLKLTNLGLLRSGEYVNLEKALKANGRFDGHFVTGHIDGTGIIKIRQQKNGDQVMTIETQGHILRYLVSKGSVAVDGVSLTVSAVSNGSFSVNLIPYTLRNTTLGLKKRADIVNIECDILAKYIEQFSRFGSQSDRSQISMSFLQEHGFI